MSAMGSWGVLGECGFGHFSRRFRYQCYRPVEGPRPLLCTLYESLRGHAAHLLSHRGRCGAGGQQGRAYLMLVATSAGSVTSRCSSSSNGTTATRTRSGISYTSVSCSQLWYTTLSCLTVCSRPARLCPRRPGLGLGLGLGLGFGLGFGFGLGLGFGLELAAVGTLGR